MSAVVVELALLVLALLGWAYARHAARAGRLAELAAVRAAADAQAAVQVALVLARAVLDHEDVEKLAAGVTWSPRDELDALLQGLDPAELARTLLDTAGPAKPERGTTPP